jgi:predicted phosphodiesterase
MKFKLKGKQPQVVILSDVHQGADGHAEPEFQATLDWIRENNAYIVLAGDLIDMGIMTPGDKSGFDKILGNALPPTEQIQLCMDTYKPFADAGKIIASVGGNHEARLQRQAMVNLPELIAHHLGVPNCLGAIACTYEWGKGNSMLGVVSHGRSGATGNVYRELRTKLLGLYPTAKFVTAGHTHNLEYTTDHSLTLDADGNNSWDTKYLIRTGNYMNRSGSAYSQEANYTPLPQGSPILTFEDDGDVSVDVDTLQYRAL